MFYPLDRAVKVTGLSTSAILKAIECGQITGTKNLFGEWEIEQSELDRVYPLLAENAVKNEPPSSTVPDATNLEAEPPSSTAPDATNLEAEPPSSTALDATNLEAEPPSSTAPDATNLEAEIGTLVKEAGESLRGESLRGDGNDAHRDAAQGADPGVADKCSAPPSKNIELEEQRRAWNLGIRINDLERVSESASYSNAQRAQTALVAAALLGALGIVGVVGIVASVLIPAQPEVHSSAHVRDSRSQSTSSHFETRWEAAPGAANTAKVAAPAASAPGRRLDPAQSTGQRPDLTKAHTAAPQTTGSLGAATSGVERRPKILPRSATPFPETKPTTIEGWTVRDVVGGIAILEGPDGIKRAARGDTVPGVGRIESIVRWGPRWMVSTSRGLISTP